MKLAIFLHFYQPPHQQLDILEAIVNQSYRRVLAQIKARPKARLTININGGLLDLLSAHKYEDVIEDLRDLLKKGQVELTGSANYHAFLPLLPKSEAERQIRLNEESLRRYFGQDLDLKGFFPPELAYDPLLSRLVKDLGYEWMAAPQIAYGPQTPDFAKTYISRDLADFRIFFRDKRLSVLILSGLVRSADSLLSELGPDYEKKEQYGVAMMDAETFGHHRPGLEELLGELLADTRVATYRISDLVKEFPQTELVSPRASTWSNEEQDFWLDREKGVSADNPFLLWQDPQNPIHQKQWEFTDWVIEEINQRKKDTPGVSWQKARKLLDEALASDQFWWASAKPWWSLEMIELGAYQLQKVMRTLAQEKPSQQSGRLSTHEDKVLKERLERTADYYRQILDLAFTWQRSGKIRQAHREASQSWRSTPFKERTPAEWYNQIILEFDDEMKKAAANLEFEKAIKWRDAIIKLKNGMDVHDVLHVVDELWSVRKIPSVKPFLKHREEEFSRFAKKHFLPLDNVTTQDQSGHH